MKVTGYACDVCERFSEKQEHWFTVTRDKQTVEVCSAKCVGKLGRQLEQAEQAEAEAVEPKPKATPSSSNGQVKAKMGSLEAHNRSHKYPSQKKPDKCKYCAREQQKGKAR